MSQHNRRRRELGLGATGQFPRGKARPDDQGELRVAIAVNGPTVYIDFGKSVDWLAMSASQAQEFAEKLLEKAKIARGEIG